MTGSAGRLCGRQLQSGRTFKLPTHLPARLPCACPPLRRRRRRHGRTLLQAPPLTIKVFAPGPNCAAFIADSASRFKPGEDIANASAWAAANGRQTLTYLGITDLSDLGTFDILFAYLGCAGDFTPTSPAAQVFTPTQSAAVAAALTSGSLKKLMVW